MEGELPCVGLRFSFMWRSQSPIEKTTDSIYPQSFSQSVAITPDCKKVVCGSMDGSVILFDIEKKQAIQKYQVSLGATMF